MNRVLVVSQSFFVLAIFGLGGSAAGRVSLAGESVESPSVRQGAKALIKEIAFKKELTIGVVEGDENYMFGKSVSFNVDKAGNIYVLDWSKKHIKKYGPEGKYDLTIGRPGQGPGDFQNPSVPRFTVDGRIYVSENFRGLVHTFDQNGNFLSQTKLPTKFSTSESLPREFVWGLDTNRHNTSAKALRIDHDDLHDQYRPLVELHKDVMDPRSTEVCPWPKGRRKSRPIFWAAQILSPRWTRTAGFTLDSPMFMPSTFILRRAK
jgi:hypothetical protein